MFDDKAFKKMLDGLTYVELCRATRIADSCEFKRRKLILGYITKAEMILKRIITKGSVIDFRDVVLPVDTKFAVNSHGFSIDGSSKWEFCRFLKVHKVSAVAESSGNILIRINGRHMTSSYPSDRVNEWLRLDFSLDRSLDEISEYFTTLANYFKSKQVNQEQSQLFEELIKANPTRYTYKNEFDIIRLKLQAMLEKNRSQLINI